MIKIEYVFIGNDFRLSQSIFKNGPVSVTRKHVPRAGEIVLFNGFIFKVADVRWDETNEQKVFINLE